MDDTLSEMENTLSNIIDLDIDILNKRQIEVILLRERGMSWREIALELHLSCYQQAQELYRNAIHKLKTYKKIGKDCPELLLAFKQYNYTYRSMSHLYHYLKRHGLLKAYLYLDPDDMEKLPKIGKRYILVMTVAQEIFDKQDRSQV